MEFDFVESKCSVYHNGYKLDKILELKDSHIIPAVSMFYSGERLEITKYECINK